MPKFYDRDAMNRGDDLVITDGDRIMTVHYYDSDADPDVFGDGGAYSIYIHDLNDGTTHDEGLLSGYETPREVVDEYLGGDPMGQSMYVVLSDVACDCGTLDELREWLDDYGVDLDETLASYYGRGV